MLGRSAQWWRNDWDKQGCFEFALDGWQRNALILCLMAVQCIDVVPNGWLVARHFDIAPYGSAMH
jgi:hypothetical protein